MQKEKISDLFLGKNNTGSLEKISGGNINVTYKSTSKDGKNYILQAINTNVFSNPVEVMENIILVTRNLSKQAIKTIKLVKAEKKKKYGYEILCDGYLVQISEDYSYWRCMEYIENSRSLKFSSDVYAAEKTGRAYGQFILHNALLKADTLNYTICDFHNLPLRLNALDKSFAAYYGEKGVFLYKIIKDLVSRVNVHLRDYLPDRITHNDTKIDNLLFDKTSGDVLAVIDLDTVMPGKITDDFGDSARSVAASVGENETDISKIFFDLEKFRYFVKGFSDGVGNLLTFDEINAMSEAVAYVTAELAVRFLKDYFDGNKYFKTDYEDHNLDRAVNQTLLLADIINKKDSIEKIIATNFRHYNND